MRKFSSRISVLTPTLTLLLTAGSGGCVSSAAQHLAVTGGEALSVEPATRDVPRMMRTELRDSGGALVGTENTIVGYDTVTVGFNTRLGERAIDEQDFYHLAGDRGAEDEIASARAKGVVMYDTGIAVMIASLATAIAVPILTTRQNASYSVGQAFLTFPIGMALAMIGANRVHDHHFSATRAFKALNTDSPGWATQLEAP